MCFMEERETTKRTHAEEDSVLEYKTFKGEIDRDTVQLSIHLAIWASDCEMATCLDRCLVR
jgi:hypothetical protein